MNRLLTILQQSKLQLLVILLLLVSSIAAIVLVDFNFGIDYARARVVSVQVDHEVELTSVEGVVADYPVQLIESLGSSRFMIYFDRLTPEQQTELVSKLESELAKATINVYDYHNEPLFALPQRLASMAIVTTLAILLFSYATLRKLGLNNGQMLALLGIEVLAAVYVCLLMLALLLGLSSAGLEVSRAGLVSAGASGFLQLFLALVFVQQFAHSGQALSQSWRALAKSLWSVYVLVAVVVFVTMALPLLVSNIDLVLIVIVTVVGMILSLFVQFVFKPMLLGLDLPALPVRSKQSATAKQVHPSKKKKVKRSKK